MRKMMQRNTMKWKILKYNIAVILGFMALTTIVFNIAIRLYLENDISQQLQNIAIRAEEITLRKGPDFFSKKGTPPPPKNNDIKEDDRQANDTKSNQIFEFYFMLDRSLRETLSVLNADYLLINSEKEIINTPEDGYFTIPENLLNKINTEFIKSDNFENESYLNFDLSGTNYIAIIKSVSHKNSFGLGWIVIYSSLQKVNQLQLVINTMLLIILVLSSLITVIFSSVLAKKLSAPFSSLNQHLSEIAQRNFCVKLDLPVDDELKELVKNINIMSEKLETYDKAQKTFLQNASHEFRTPLMSIQCYAEGIKYEVIDSNTAVAVILEETKRMANLVEDLIYLSRLDTIEENYHFNKCSFLNLINSCVDRMNRIAEKNNINLFFDGSTDNVHIFADDEKLSRAITNILSNDIRYAKSKVTLSLEFSISASQNALLHLSILDDGPGFDSNELPNIFDRFYKGKKGNFGLGLAIAKNVIEKHNGTISAKNTESGALFIIDLPTIM